LLVDSLRFFSARDRLIERQINLIGFVCLSLLDLGHRRPKEPEAIGHGLINQNIAIGEKKHESVNGDK